MSGQNYDFQCDVWSCGVIAYTLLSAQMPFYGEDNREIFQKIVDLDYLFPDRYFKKVSDTGMKLQIRAWFFKTKSAEKWFCLIFDILFNSFFSPWFYWKYLCYKS